MRRVEVILATALTLGGAPIRAAAVEAGQENAALQESPEAPTEPAPEGTPPAPPAQPPAPPAQAQPAAAETPSGQWVYTDQYGWVWIPYGDVYTYVPQSGDGEPYEYVYYPYYGWCWVAAPWIWGVGPWPYFGAYGAVHFGWYGYGYWRTPWLYHYRPAPAPVPFHGAPPFHGGIRPTPVRGIPPPAPAGARGVVAHHGTGGGGGHGHGDGHH